MNPPLLMDCCYNCLWNVDSSVASLSTGLCQELIKFNKAIMSLILSVQAVQGLERSSELTGFLLKLPDPTGDPGSPATCEPGTQMPLLLCSMCQMRAAGGVEWGRCGMLIWHARSHFFKKQQAQHHPTFLGFFKSARGALQSEPPPTSVANRRIKW